MEIDNNNPIPLHVQLKDILKKQVLEGEFTSQIPSERELMEVYSVSRSTVREAVSILVREGILEKRHGKGTFVSLKPVQEWIQMNGFTEIVKKMEIKLIEHGIVPTPENISNMESFKHNCYLIKRLRLKDGVPIAVENCYYPLEIGKKLENYDLNNTILYDVLVGDLGIIFWDTEQIISCHHPSKEVANFLNISESMCCLATERMNADPSGNIFEYYEGIFRSDMYSFTMKMSRKPNV
ncbi:GntR family transcriptional regulator [Alkalihalobacillus deserti]|uniref:GntR family transcriptional regulator n=1 Tax=Alkalihalobacillus deserti TaxID=2879466 RepID=UPI001D1391CE|nr:GntR family transcriptional regulator [Alkalihalobacillus deserti]